MPRWPLPIKSYFASSLSRAVLAQLGLALLVAIMALTWVSYVRSARELEAKSLDELRAIVSARAHDGAELFTAAERNTLQLRDEYLRRLAGPRPPDWQADFDRWFERRADGVVRVRQALDDHHRLPSLYLRPQVPLDDDVTWRTWVAFQLLREWGPVMTSRYYSAYFDLPAEGLIMYSPSVNWGALATATSNNLDYPPVAGASPARNPKRLNHWTPTYFDDKAGIFMVSTVTPIDRGNRWIACVSQDVSIDELLRRTLDERLPGTFNVILSRDGNLVTHPKFVEKLAASKGNVSLAALHDPLLDEIAALPVPTDGEVLMRTSRDGAYLLGVANIEGPDWIYATVYPMSLLRDRALGTARFLMAAGAVALFGLLLLMHWILQRQIGRPVGALQAAAREVAQGRFDVELDRGRRDELGQLAGAFADMGTELQYREERLAADAALLEENQHLLEERLRQLQASEQKFRLVFDRSPAILALLEAPGNRFVDVNEVALRTFGFRREEVIGRSVEELGLWAERDARADLVARLRSESSFSDEATVLRTRAGQLLDVVFSRSPVRIDGRDYGLVTIRDVTERNQAERARQLLEAQLRESQKMEAVGTLAGGIAHDFNNILGAMLGNLQLAQAALDDAHPARALLEPVQSGALRASRLVRQILTFGRRHQHAQVNLPLRPVVDDALRLLRATLPASVALETRLADEPLHAVIDDTQIQQVLINLCTNAWHALPGGRGRIEVGLAAGPGSDGSGLGSIHLWVRDNGAGIDEATRGRLFEPFFTTKPVGQGTGLGLAVVHGIVTSHRGRIDVESTPGAGSVFHVHLPRTAAAAREEAARPAARSGPIGRGERLLYVDDDEVMTVMVQRLMQVAGYAVTCAIDGAEALEMVRTRPDRFDIVVTDYNMPALSGLDLARALAAIRPDLPVVITSGYIADEVRAQAEALGVRALLYKEDTYSQLAGLVRQVLTEAARRG